MPISTGGWGCLRAHQVRGRKSANCTSELSSSNRSRFIIFPLLPVQALSLPALRSVVQPDQASQGTDAHWLAGRLASLERLSPCYGLSWGLKTLSLWTHALLRTDLRGSIAHGAFRAV